MRVDEVLLLGYLILLEADRLFVNEEPTVRPVGFRLSGLDFLICAVFSLEAILVCALDDMW
jgi:hypothetical protein